MNAMNGFKVTHELKKYIFHLYLRHDCALNVGLSVEEEELLTADAWKKQISIICLLTTMMTEQNPEQAAASSDKLWPYPGTLFIP